MMMMMKMMSFFLFLVRSYLSSYRSQVPILFFFRRWCSVLYVVSVSDHFKFESNCCVCIEDQFRQSRTGARTGDLHQQNIELLEKVVEETPMRKL